MAKGSDATVMKGHWFERLEIPPTKALMSPFPIHLDRHDSVQRARELMSEYDIHHLPVKDDAALVGIVSERDLRGVDEGVVVERVMTADPYAVDLNVPVDEVLLELARRNIGSAVVVRGNKLAGILTTTDACRWLAELLQRRAGKSPGGHIA